jgi:hypothetical protein
VDDLHRPRTDGIVIPVPLVVIRQLLERDEDLIAQEHRVAGGAAQCRRLALLHAAPRAVEDFFRGGREPLRRIVSDRAGTMDHPGDLVRLLAVADGARVAVRALDRVRRRHDAVGDLQAGLARCVLRVLQELHLERHLPDRARDVEAEGTRLALNHVSIGERRR